ncbi:MAG: hypothetical protein L0Z68_01160 [Gammaproteobacteria bacterium]|nr:hypothetical protein [Gammaproteobacteria bacterium]
MVQAYQQGANGPVWMKLIGAATLLVTIYVPALPAAPLAPDTPLTTNEDATATSSDPKEPSPTESLSAPEAVPTPETGPPQGDESAPGGPEPYVDQLISEELLAEELEAEEAVVPGVGREFLITEYRFFNQTITDVAPEYENGLAAFWRRETLDYGTLSVDVLGKYVINDSTENGEDRLGDSFTLRQEEFALTNRLQMDNFLGDARAVTNPLISQTFRFNLPSSIIRGGSSAVYSENTEFRVTGGLVGRLDGVAIPTFENLGDTLWGLGVTHGFEKNWSVGLQGWSLNDNPVIPNHESVAGGIEYASDEARQRHQLHSLYDTTGHLGFWYDGDSWIERWRHRYGLFRFDPALLWTDVQIANDREGLYWRAENRTFRRDWTTGIDYVKTNIDANPTLAGQKLGTGFLSTAWRVRRRTQLGGIANLALQRSGAGLPSNGSDTYQLTGFLDQGTRLGQSRLQLVFGEAFIDQDPDVQNYQITWDQEWAVPATHRLGTTVSFEREEEDGDETNRTRLQGTYARDITTNLNVNGSANLVVTDGDSAGDGRDLNVNLGLFWQLLRNWSANFSINYDRNLVEPPGVARLTLENARIFFTLRRTQETGSAPAVYGRQTGQHGTGRVAGRVFLDESRDGRWQPNEPGVAGLSVYLDGRFAGQTDKDGLYSVGPVAAGEHQVFIALEDVPLPWGLTEETPRRFDVQVRQQAEVNFPLERLNQ